MVIAIIGILIALLLPAVRAAREAARRTECKNHLKQIALACHLHHDTLGFFPNAGSNWNYGGDPDRGFGETQPGAWTYSILPFLEQQALFDLGTDGEPERLTSQQRRASRVRTVTPLATYHCPSRRAADRYPSWALFGEPGSGPVNSLGVSDGFVAKGDYAINGGSVLTEGLNATPATFNASMAMDWPPGPKTNGMAYNRSEVQLKDVTDGAAQTILVAEKFLEPSRYETTGWGDHHGLWVMYWDTIRFAGEDVRILPLQDADLGNVNVMRDVNSCCPFRFGGPHVGGMQAAMADASVQFISFDIDPVTYARLGSRNDGEPLANNPF